MSELGTQINFQQHQLQTQLNFGAAQAAANAANDAGRTAINSLILASGGAVVALLAFLGTVMPRLSSKDVKDRAQAVEIVHAITVSLSNFAYSMFAAIVAACVTYIALFMYATARLGVNKLDKRTNCIGHVCNAIAIVCGLISLFELFRGALQGLQLLNSIH